MPRLNLPSFSRLSKLFFKPQPDLSKLARSFLSLSKSTRLFIKRSKPPRLFKVFFKGPQPVSKTIQTVPLNDLDHLNYLRGLLDCYLNPLKHLNCRNCRLNPLLNCLNKLNSFKQPKLSRSFPKYFSFCFRGSKLSKLFFTRSRLFFKVIRTVKKIYKTTKTSKTT